MKFDHVIASLNIAMIAHRGNLNDARRRGDGPQILHLERIVEEYEQAKMLLTMHGGTSDGN